MAYSDGPQETPGSLGGSEATSSEKRRDALLQSTVDELADLFRIEECFPFHQELDDDSVDEGRVGFWGRVANWFSGRSSRTGKHSPPQGSHQP